MKLPIEITSMPTQFEENIVNETNTYIARMGYNIKFNKAEMAEMLQMYINPPLSIKDLQLLIGKPIFNNNRKEWYLLIAVRDGVNKEIDVIGARKQYKETYGYRNNCFYAREVKE